MTEKDSYYAEIAILVEGWPWNLSEFPLRSWFADGACPRALLIHAASGEISIPKFEEQVSENRRADRKTKTKKQKKKHKNKRHAA